MAELFNVPATIANGASLSSSVFFDRRTPVAIEMPATWTAANLTFQASFDNATFNDVYDEDGNEYTVTAAAARHIAIDHTKLQGARYIKVRSGTTAVPVNQAAARELGILMGHIA